MTSEINPLEVCEVFYDLMQEEYKDLLAPHEDGPSEGDATYEIASRLLLKFKEILEEYCDEKECDDEDFEIHNTGNTVIIPLQRHLLIDRHFQYNGMPLYSRILIERHYVLHCF